MTERLELSEYSIRKAGTRGFIITIPEIFIKGANLSAGDRLVAFAEEKDGKLRLVYENPDSPA